MSEPARDEAVSDSGGTMRRLTGPPTDAVPDLALLASLRRVIQPGSLRPAGGAPYFTEGQTVTWHYGAWSDVLRVVRDDPRGLVAWLPPGSERLIRDIAEQARREQVDPRVWPLDEGWEDWRPPSEWDQPLTLPASVLEAVSNSGAPVRRTGETSPT